MTASELSRPVAFVGCWTASWPSLHLHIFVQFWLFLNSWVFKKCFTHFWPVYSYKVLFIMETIYYVIN